METPIVWLEKNLNLINIVVDARDKPENKNKVFSEEQLNYHLELIKLKNGYEKAIALLKAADIN